MKVTGPEQLDTRKKLILFLTLTIIKIQEYSHSSPIQRDRLSLR